MNINAEQVKEILENWTPKDETNWPVIEIDSDGDADLIGELDSDGDFVNTHGVLKNEHTILADLKANGTIAFGDHAVDFAMLIENAWGFIPGPEFKVLDRETGEWTGEGTFKVIPNTGKVIYQDNTDGFELMDDDFDSAEIEEIVPATA